MMGAFAQPFAVLVVSDLLGVPAEDRIKFRQQLIRQEREGATIGGTEDRKADHSPLEWLYSTFSAYIEDRRQNPTRSEEHTSELQSLMRISYAVFCLKKKKKQTN